jgi:hypothetical protein
MIFKNKGTKIQVTKEQLNNVAFNTKMHPDVRENDRRYDCLLYIV